MSVKHTLPSNTNNFLETQQTQPSNDMQSSAFLPSRLSKNNDENKITKNKITFWN